MTTVLVERRDAVTIVTLNRPEKRNAVDRDTAARLADAFRGLRREFEHGLVSLRADTVAGASRFAGGARRHGAFG